MTSNLLCSEIELEKERFNELSISEIKSLEIDDESPMRQKVHKK